MIVCCPSCAAVYDDLYRLTFCPHLPFEMRTVCYREVEGLPLVFVATSIEVFDRFHSGALTLDQALDMGAQPLDRVAVWATPPEPRPEPWFDRVAKAAARRRRAPVLTGRLRRSRGRS